MLAATLADVQPTALAIEGEATEADGVTEGWFTFETAAARGSGHLRLKDGKCWTLLTTMTELKGFEESERPARGRRASSTASSRGARPGSSSGPRGGAELGVSRAALLRHHRRRTGRHRAGARLKRLGVPTLIIEKNERPGDSWRNRYKSLCLHDPVWYDHLPYLPFPDHWPVFSPKDKIGDWLEMYAKVMELNYWHSTDCEAAPTTTRRRRTGR